MKFQEFKNILLSDQEFRDEYEKNEVERNISHEILMARMKRGITQKQLAKMVGTKQPSIARLENGEKTPSISFLKKIATAFKTKLLVGFEMNQKDCSITATFNLSSAIKPNENLITYYAYSQTNNKYLLV